MSNFRFNGVPLVQYNDGFLTDLTNIILLNWTEGNTFFVEYVIEDGDTAENICYRLWNDSSLSWILYLANGIIDPFFDWPLRSDELVGYVKNKYGDSAIYDAHHYTKNGFVVNYDPADESLHKVTNYQYEFELNEEKRHILLPTDTFIQTFLTKRGE